MISFLQFIASNNSACFIHQSWHHLSVEHPQVAYRHVLLRYQPLLHALLEVQFFGNHF